MKFSVALMTELSKHSSKENRAKVCSSVYRQLESMGFDLAIVNDRGFQNYGSDRVYWIRRNNGLGCWEIA